MDTSALLVEVWRQVLIEGRSEVMVGADRWPVVRTHRLGLRSVSLATGELRVEGIEQNPRTRSRWAKLATDGAQIMQFSWRGRYIGNVCDGRLTRYAAWSAMERSTGCGPDPT